MKNHQNSVKYSRMVALIPNVGSKHSLAGRTQRKRKQKSGRYGGAGGYPQSWGAKKIFFGIIFFGNRFRSSVRHPSVPLRRQKKCGGKRKYVGATPLDPLSKSDDFCTFFAFHRPRGHQSLRVALTSFVELEILRRIGGSPLL